MTDKQRVVFFLGLGVGVLLIGLPFGCQSKLGNGSQGESVSVPSPIGGKLLFDRYCSSCHGLNGVGDGTIARLLKKPPPDLRYYADRREGKFSYTEIARFIDGRHEVSAHGTRLMPVWGQEFGKGIPGEQQDIVNGTLLELVSYIESLQVGRGKP